MKGKWMSLKEFAEKMQSQQWGVPACIPFLIHHQKVIDAFKDPGTTKVVFKKARAIGMSQAMAEIRREDELMSHLQRK